MPVCPARMKIQMDVSVDGYHIHTVCNGGVHFTVQQLTLVLISLLFI